jgi:hypothetical protein
MTAQTFPSEMLGQHLAIVGKAGSGKTYAAKGLVEGLLRDKRRVCILDPTGVWWGLRSSADGDAPGFPVAVFGGAHADVPIGEQSGAVLAGLLASQNLPAIVDLSEMLIGQRHRFVTDFAESLYRDNRTPLHLVIDEADEFCPQNPMPETKRMLHHVDRIVRRGRVRGFRVMLITQRPAVLHKNVLTQANTLIAMRLTAPQDRNAVKAWVDGQGDAEQGAQVLKSLAGLTRGTGWVWAPELSFLERVPFPLIETFDSSRTPGDDETIAEPTTLAAVDVDDIRASLAPPPKPAAQARGGPTEADVQRRVAAATDDLRKAVEHLRASMASAALRLRAAIDDMEAGMAAPESVVHVIVAPPIVPPRVNGGAAKLKRYEWINPDDHGDDEDPPLHLLEPAQRIADAIMWWHSVGIEQPTRHQVAFVAGYTVNGHFNNTLGKMRGEDFISYPAGNCVALTSKGLQHAKRPERSADYAGLCHKVEEVLRGEPQRRLFSIVANHGNIARADLATRSGYTVNGHFNNTLGTLNRLGVIRYPSPGQVGLGEMFDALR